MSSSLFGAFDIGGTKISACIANESRILGWEYQYTQKEGDERTVPRQMLAMIAQLCERQGRDPGAVRSLGISAVSPFLKKSGMIYLRAPMLCGGISRQGDMIPNDWTEIPLEEELSAAFPELHIVNDCAAAVTAEYYFSYREKHENIAYVTWSTGIGGAAIVDGHLLRGKNNNAMHVGHTFLHDYYAAEPRCFCGDSGHLEAYIAGAALESSYGAPPARLFEDYRNNSPGALELVRDSARRLARGLINVAVFLDPKLIVVGGSIAVHNWDILGPLISKEFYSHIGDLTSGVLLERSTLGTNAGTLGALAMVVSRKTLVHFQEHRPWE
jgi:glucokinase